VSSSSPVPPAGFLFALSVLRAGFASLPAGSVFARYAPLPGGQPGQVAVVSSCGVVLASSFFELRHRFSFVCSVSGAGGWVALAPVAPAASQPGLF